MRSFTASVINLFFQENAEARVSGVRYFNMAIVMLVLYALITLNPYALYKSFMKRRKRSKDGKKPKKKRIRVLNYEPIPDYTEQKSSRSEKSSNTSESSWKISRETENWFYQAFCLCHFTVPSRVNFRAAEPYGFKKLFVPLYLIRVNDFICDLSKGIFYQSFQFPIISCYHDSFCFSVI